MRRAVLIALMTGIVSPPTVAAAEGSRLQRALSWRPKTAQRWRAKIKKVPMISRTPVTLKQLDSWSDDRGRAAWQQQLKAVGFRAAIIPVGGGFDARKPLVVLVPGKGDNLRDMRQAAKVSRKGYQVVIAITDHKRSWNKNGKELATGLSQLMQQRRADRVKRGLPHDSHVQIYGHSAGSMTSWRALVELQRQGQLRADGKGTFSAVDHFVSDGPTRGLDVPFLLKLPGVRHIAGAVAPKIPFLRKKGITKGVLSLVNGARLMKAVTAKDSLPKLVRTHFLTAVEGKNKAPSTFRWLEPLANGYSHELTQRELGRLYKTLKRAPLEANPLLDHERLASLRHWSRFKTTRINGLTNILRTRSRAEGYGAFAGAVHRAAHQSKDLKAFARAYDNSLSRLVATFHGKHTDFHWSYRPGEPIQPPVRREHLANTSFLRWFSGKLASNRARAASSAR